MTRYAVTVAYDGTDYHGWQVQPDEVSVQQVLETAFGTLCGGASPRIQGSGRTDTGVHARGQVFHVDPDREGYAPEKWREALNGVLPRDIRVRDVWEVSADFHARYSAVRKEYRYFVHPGRHMPPDLRRYRLEVSHALDWALMGVAADMLRGHHDFTSFSATRGEEDGNPVRTVEALDLVKDGEGFFVRAVADGFLYKMMRRVTGALLQVGGGELSLERLDAFLNRPGREPGVTTAPPHGLFLWKVDYGECDED